MFSNLNPVQLLIAVLFILAVTLLIYHVICAGIQSRNEIEKDCTVVKRKVMPVINTQSGLSKIGWIVLFEEFLRGKRILTKYLDAAGGGANKRSLAMILRDIHYSVFLASTVLYTPTSDDEFWSEVNNDWLKLCSEKIKSIE